MRGLKSILVAGMHGLGDNVHQRAVVRQLIERCEPVWLETPWPCVYHDLVGPNLLLLNKSSRLRTQAANAKREQEKFSQIEFPTYLARRLQVRYRPDDVRRHGSVLGAMLEASGCDRERFDFRLPVPKEWEAKAQRWLDQWRPAKPIMIYRPLNERTEWSGCSARNPDFDAYAQIYNRTRSQFFVVSIADTVPQVEWLVGREVDSDAQCHKGELDFETIAALTKRASLVYASPGFVIPLAQAVGTPSVCIFGGYENSSSFSLGARLTPHLGIDPITPCQCFQHQHNCQKQIDMVQALDRLDNFIQQHCPR